MTAPWDSQFGIWFWDIDLLDWRKLSSDDLKEISEPCGNYIKRMAYDANDLLEYLGVALPGTSSASTGWKIVKMTYSSSKVTSYLFAGGSSGFNFVWDDRASYSYS